MLHDHRVAVMPRPVSPHPDTARCVGVVLAGGEGRRLGGDKATVTVQGRPLLYGPLAALGAVCSTVAVVARPDTALPPFPQGAPDLWLEGPGPRHPLTGVVHALRQAAGRAVLVCAVDLPLLDVLTLRIILAAAEAAPEAAAVVPRTQEHLQVLCALYRPAALASLQRFDPNARVADLVGALGPAIVPFDDATPFFNVNTPQDVLTAGLLLDQRAAAATTRT